MKMYKLILPVLTLIMISACNSNPVKECPYNHRFGAVCQDNKQVPERDAKACQQRGGVKEWLCSKLPVDGRKR